MSTQKKTSQPLLVPKLTGDKVIVKHYRLHPNSPDVDSSSVRYQHYDTGVFDEYEREDEATGKQNTFVRMGGTTGKYEVLYDPRKAKQSGAPAETEEEKNARLTREKEAKEKAEQEKEQKRIADEAFKKQKAEETAEAKEAEKAEKKRKADEEKQKKDEEKAEALRKKAEQNSDL